MDKQSLRERVWDALEDSGDARFPFPPHGRIPNFAGADEAAVRSAYRERVKEVHPDRPSGDEDEFKRVNRAYERLTEEPT